MSDAPGVLTPAAPATIGSALRPTLAATLAICFGAQVLATSSVLALAAIAPQASSSLGIPPSWIGYQVSVIYFAGIFASAIAGSLVRRWGAARLNQIALYCAGGGLIGLTSGVLPVMLAASALIGIGYAFNNPCSSHMLHRLTPPRLRNLVFSVKQAGVPIGGMVAALTMPRLAEPLGWQGALLVGAIPGLLLGAAFGILRAWWDDDREPGAPIAGAILRGQRIVWTDGGVRAVALLGLLYSAVQLCVSVFMVTMLVTEFGWSPAQAGGAAALVQVCGAIGRVAWGLVADACRAGFLVLAVIGAATGVCCLALALGGHMPRPAWIGLLCLLGLCAVGWNGVMLAETARLSARSGPGLAGFTLTGDVLVYTFIGVVLGPSLFALAYTHVGQYGATFALFCVPAFIGTALGFWMHVRDPNR